MISVFIQFDIHVSSAVLNAWAHWAVARGPHENRGHMPIYVCSVQHVFLFLFKLLFCWKYQYNKYMFNFIDIYIFIPVSGCVGRGPQCTALPGDQ